MVRKPDATMQPAPQDNQLMSKHRVLSFKPHLRLEWRGQDGQNEIKQPDHSASLGDSITSSTRMRFSVHTGHIYPPEISRLGFFAQPSKIIKNFKVLTNFPFSIQNKDGSDRENTGCMALLDDDEASFFGKRVIREMIHGDAKHYAGWIMDVAEGERAVCSIAFESAMPRPDQPLENEMQLGAVMSVGTNSEA